MWIAVDIASQCFDTEARLAGWVRSANTRCLSSVGIPENVAVAGERAFVGIPRADVGGRKALANFLSIPASSKLRDECQGWSDYRDEIRGGTGKEEQKLESANLSEGEIG